MNKKLSVMKHVLCTMMDVSDIFQKKTCNIVLIKQSENSLQLFENVPPLSTILIKWWYNADQRLLPSCLSHQTKVRGTRHYISGNTPSHRFSYVWQSNNTRSKYHTLHPSLAVVFVPVSQISHSSTFAGRCFCTSESFFCTCTYKITFIFGC